MPKTTPDILPLATEGVHTRSAWEGRIQAAKDKRKKFEKGWKENVDAYEAKLLTLTPTRDEVVVPTDYSNVEQKKALLFFQSPEVQLKAEMPGLEDAITVFQPVLNRYLGPSGVDAKVMMTEVIFDVLCPSGFGASKIGYEATQDGTVPIQVGQQPVMDEAGQPVFDPRTMAPVMAPIIEQVPRIVHEAYFWERISPIKTLIPSDFQGSDFDKAAWLGLEFRMNRVVASRLYDVPADDLKAGDEDDAARKGLSPEPNTEPHDEDEITGVELWYKAALFDKTVKHPRRIRQLVLLDGIDRPVVHRDSPYQHEGEDGRLTGMDGFPIHILTLRYVSDSAYPPSDCAMSRGLISEKNRGRTQMIRQRDRSVPMRWGDINRIGQDTIDKVNSGEIQAMIPTNGPGNEQIGEIARAQFPRENFTFNDIIDRDIQEVWSLGANQKGVVSDTARTATELNIIQNNTSVRLDAERTRVLEWYLEGVRKLASLIQQFADQPDYVEIVGQEDAARLEQWDKTRIQGKFAFSAKPDSSIRIDAAQDRQQKLQLYNLTANDPFINRQQTAKLVAESFHLDPQKVMQQPPPKPPEAPNISFRFSEEAFNPVMPQFAIVMELLKIGGYAINPQVIAQAQQHAKMQTMLQNAIGPPKFGPDAPQLPNSEHGGAAEGIAPISKHAEQTTGGLPGMGVQ